jgi:hypothetical protein
MVNFKDILLILLPILLALIGSFFTYLLTIRQFQKERVIQFREEKYAKLLNTINAFIGETATPELKRDFFKERQQALLYASDDVIKRIDEFIELVRNPSGEDDSKALSRIVLSMRKDLLGNKNKLLENEIIFYTVIDDKKSN